MQPRVVSTAVFVLFSLATCVMAETYDRSDIAVLIVARPEHDRLQIALEGKEIPSERAMDVLGETLLEMRRPAGLWILVHERVSLEDMLELRGMAMKVGFESIRVFVFNDGRRRMLELHLTSSAVPYTETPGHVADSP